MIKEKRFKYSCEPSFPNADDVMRFVRLTKKVGNLILLSRIKK